MLSENEKDANRKFFAATGKTPRQEADNSSSMLGLVFMGSMALIALGAGIYYLLH